MLRRRGLETKDHKDLHARRGRVSPLPDRQPEHLLGLYVGLARAGIAAPPLSLVLPFPDAAVRLSPLASPPIARPQYCSRGSPDPHAHSPPSPSPALPPPPPPPPP